MLCTTQPRFPGDKPGLFLRCVYAHIPYTNASRNKKESVQISKFGTSSPAFYTWFAHLPRGYHARLPSPWEGPAGCCRGVLAYVFSVCRPQTQPHGSPWLCIQCQPDLCNSHLAFLTSVLFGAHIDLSTCHMPATLPFLVIIYFEWKARENNAMFSTAFIFTFSTQIKTQQTLPRYFSNKLFIHFLCSYLNTHSKFCL